MKLIKLSTLRCDSSGVSLIEVLVALLIFSSTVLGLSAMGMVAGKQLRMSRTDMRVWTAVHYQMDKLTAIGYDNLTAGAETVQGSGMSWEIWAPGFVSLSAAFDTFCNGLVGGAKTTCLAAPDWGMYCAGLPAAKQATCSAALAAAQAAAGDGTNAKKVILVVYAANSHGVMVPDTFVTYVADPNPN